MPRFRFGQAADRESELKFGQKWLLIAGVVLTVLAVGWFLKYSFERNWISPATRVTMAYLAGIGFMLAGECFRRRHLDVFGLCLIGGGIADLYFASFAAFQIYHLLSQPLAFGLMILTTALAGTLSLVYDTKWLALLGLIGGFVTPILLSTGQDNQVVLMTYLTILNAGILSIAFFKEWRVLNYLGFFFTWVLFTGWYCEYYVEERFWSTTVFLNVFFLTYAFVPFACHVMGKRDDRLIDIGMITLNSFIAFAYSFAMIEAYFSTEAVSIVSVAYAAIFLWMAQMAYRHNRARPGTFVVMIAKGTLFLVLTIPILFSRHWITFFWAIQAVVLLWAALKLQHRLLYGGFAVLLAVTLVKFFVYDYPEVFHLRWPGVSIGGGYTHLLLERFITSALVLGAVFLSARLMAQLDKKMSALEGKDRAVCWGAFGMSLLAALNVEVASFFFDYAPQARFAAISVLWALFSVGLIVLGFLKNEVLLRRFAIGLFGITIVKVFLVDMCNVSTPYRITSFMVLGVMLIGASYLYHRFKDRILPRVDTESR